jgi:alkanesulfonate monooxygenase SsuD/methylene tetrahydromethanopterin reductase-like flavin-dependent oxidoreductase (luciferase family)
LVLANTIAASFSIPAVILGAAAARTKRIRLTSAVTVLSAEDPVRVFQNFATIDLLSRGRAEMFVGRGSSIEVPIWPGVDGTPQGPARSDCR